MKKTFEMRLFITICAVFLVGFMAVSVALPSNYHFVQFRVMTIPDADAAAVIDQKIGSKSGVKESRADYITSTYFCLLAPDAGYTKDDFVNWFTKLGYEITCYTRGVQNTDVVVSPHTLKLCVEEEKQ